MRKIRHSNEYVLYSSSNQYRVLASNNNQRITAHSQLRDKFQNSTCVIPGNLDFTSTVVAVPISFIMLLGFVEHTN